MSYDFNKFSKKVKDLVRDRQTELTKDKDRKVPIQQTLEIMLKDAYLPKEEKVAP